MQIKKYFYLFKMAKQLITVKKDVIHINPTVNETICMNKIKLSAFCCC